MSAWEGSAWQDAQELRALARAARREQLKRENPSLGWDDVDVLLAREEAAQDAHAPAKCCPCQSSRRAEYVRSTAGPVVCGCSCHGGKP